MQVKTFDIEGLKLIELKAFADSRGFFTERYNKENFKKVGVDIEVLQDNFSRSLPGVVRGLHYQYSPIQGKLVTCLNGKIFDVAVDIRKDSPTFGKHVSVILDGDQPTWFWIPGGFAHGFCVLGDKPADVMYKVNNYWNGKGENGILWNDKDLNISWPKLNQTILSDKDLGLQSFKDYKTNPAF